MIVLRGTCEGLPLMDGPIFDNIGEDGEEQVDRFDSTD